jgi:hypothetical protein
MSHEQCFSLYKKASRDFLLGASTVTNVKGQDERFAPLTLAPLPALGSYEMIGIISI